MDLRKRIESQNGKVVHGRTLAPGTSERSCHVTRLLGTAGEKTTLSPHARYATTPVVKIASMLRLKKFQALAKWKYSVLRNACYG